MSDEFAFIELQLIEPSLTNPRKTFNQAKLTELTDSIKASGVHQPVLVRKLPLHRVVDTSTDTATGKPRQVRPAYELVCGERRYRASKLAGKDAIPALIRELTDDQVMEIQIVENLQRDDLTELEEAEGYEALMQHSGLTATAAVRAEYAERLKGVKAQLNAATTTAPISAAGIPSQGEGGEPKPKAPKGTTRKPKLTAEEATLGIAAAMQGLEVAASAPEGAVAPPAVPADVQVQGFEVGMSVRIVSDVDKLGSFIKKLAGRSGVIKKRESGGGYWHVSVKPGGMHILGEDQIERVSA